MWDWILQLNWLLKSGIIDFLLSLSELCFLAGMHGAHFGDHTCSCMSFIVVILGRFSTSFWLKRPFIYTSTIITKLYELTMLMLYSKYSSVFSILIKTFYDNNLDINGNDGFSILIMQFETAHVKGD